MIVLIYFFLNAQAGGILRILQSDWVWKRAEFFFLACQPGRKQSPACENLCDKPTLGPKVDFFEAF